jgi:hypothetical protein
VLAAGDDGVVIRVGDGQTDVRNTTFLANTANDRSVFQAANFKSGIGVEAYSDAGRGLSASSSTGSGVSARSGHGAAVHAMAGNENVANDHYPAAVLGEMNQRDGVCILGNNYATRGSAEGVQGTTDSIAGYATTGWARKGGTALVGASGPGFPSGRVPRKTGVYGYAQGGRGGVFDGPLAQLRLIPSTAAMHPGTGAAGDLFVDRSHRLWFCLGGASWKRVKLV